MEPIDQLIKYQNRQIEYEKRKLQELQLLEKAIDSGSLFEARIENVADGYYEIVIKADQISNELLDTLELSIVSDLQHKRSDDGKLVLEGTLDYNPMSVATELKPGMRRGEE